MRKTFFTSLAEFIIRSHRAILIGGLVITAFAILLITRLHVDFSLDSLLPHKDHRSRELLSDLEDMGSQDALIALVSVAGPEQLDDGKTVVDEFVRKMASFPSIGSLNARVTAQQQRFFTEVLMPNAALFLSEGERSDLVERLSDASIHRQIQENKRFLSMPMQGGAGELIVRDPLGLRGLWLSRWFSEQTFKGLELSDGYLVDKDHRHLLVFIHPKEPARNIEYTRELMTAATNAADDAMRAWSRLNPAAANGPRIDFAGGYCIASADEKLARGNLQSNIILSFIGVNLLFLIVYRNPRFLLLIQVPLAMGIIWTFGALKLVFGHINILTGAFAGVQLAMGIDFAIYFFNLYLDAWREGRDRAAALRVALEKGGYATLVGGVTTAAAFLALGASSFRGFRELGIITCIGMCACLITMLVILPAMMMVWRQDRGRPMTSSPPVPDFGLKFLIPRVLARPRRVFLATLAVLTTLCVSAFGVSFDNDLRALRPQKAPYMEAEKKVESLLGGANHYLLLVTEGDDEDDLLNRTWRLTKALDRLQEEGKLSHYRSVFSYLPAPESQGRAITFLRQHADELNPGRFEATFRRELQESGFQFLPEYDSYLEWLRALVRTEKPLDRHSFEEADVAELLSHSLVSRGSSHKLITYIYPRAALWRQADLDHLSADLDLAATEAGFSRDRWRLSGFPVLVDHLKKLMLVDLRDTLTLSFMAILAVLFIGFRKPSLVALAFVPLAAGMVALVGIMALISLPFNYANFIALPIIVGIGIDYGVHLVGHWHENPQKRLDEVLRETGRAIVLSALITMVGFGSLMGSNYPGLRSIDWVMALGISTCVIASLVLLPVVLLWVGQRAAGRSASPSPAK